MTELEKLKKLTRESDEESLSILLEDAKQFVLGYTNRTWIIPELTKTVRDLAVIAYNRNGTEGESSRNQGGVSSSFDERPKHIYDILNKYRLVRCGGKVYETKESTDVSS